MERSPFSESWSTPDISAQTLRQIGMPAPPQKDLESISAENEDPIAYGFPIRPDRERGPKQHAKWESIVTKQHNFIHPKFESPGGEEESEPEERNKTGRRWSGAMDTDPGTDDHFDTVMSSWVVPKAYPQKSQDRWRDGKYKCGTWVGLDGYDANKNILLQAGTISFCIASDNEITEQTAKFFFEWLPCGPRYLDEPKLSPSDNVTVIVDGCFPSVGLGTSGTDRVPATISIYNDTTGEYTILELKSKKKRENYKGDTAEWIVEAPREQSKWEMPDIGTIRLIDCLAVTVSGKERDLTGATLIDCIQDGVKLATAREESDRVLDVTVGSNPISEGTDAK